MTNDTASVRAEAGDTGAPPREQPAPGDALRALRITDAQRSGPREREREPTSRIASRRMLLRLAVIVIAVGGAAVAAWAYARARPAPVDVVPVSSGRAGGAERAALVTAGGYVKHPRVVHVVPRVAGVIATLDVREGDEVREGAVIATLESNELAQGAAEARAGLRLAEARLAELEAGARPEELAEANARVEALRLTAERLERDSERGLALVDAGALSAQAFDRLTSESLVAAKSLEAARQSLALLAAGPRREAIEGARAAAAGARARLVRARELSDRTRIRAPLTGRVLRKFLDVGSAVSFGIPFTEGYSTLAAGSPIVSIGQLDGLEATADIREADLAHIAVGQAVDVRADAYPDRSFRASVARIAPRADRNKNTVEVTVRLEDPAPRELVQDLSVKLTFLTDRERPGPPPVAVPASAVLTRGESRFVFVVRDGRAHLREVTTEKRLGDGKVPVTSGVREGELLVVSPAESLQDGSAVTVNGSHPEAAGGTP